MKSLKNKFTIAALVIGSHLGVARAAPIVIFEAPLNAEHQEVSAGFAVNRELGRAWIDVKVSTDPIGEEGREEVIIMKMLEGLYYDSARKQLLYRTASEPIVCAQDAQILWTTYLKSTGQCLLNPHTEQRKVDNGFEVHQQTVAQVVFDAQAQAVGMSNR